MSERETTTLCACTGCGYWFWAYGDDQRPTGDAHCTGGRWVYDFDALAADPAVSSVSRDTTNG